MYSIIPCLQPHLEKTYLIGWFGSLLLWRPTDLNISSYWYIPKCGVIFVRCGIILKAFSFIAKLFAFIQLKVFLCFLGRSCKKSYFKLLKDEFQVFRIQTANHFPDIFVPYHTQNHEMQLDERISGNLTWYGGVSKNFLSLPFPVFLLFYQQKAIKIKKYIIFISF